MAKKSQRRRSRNNKSRSRRVKGGGTAQEWIDAFTTFQSLKDKENFQEILNKIKNPPYYSQDQFVDDLGKNPDFSDFKNKINDMTNDDYILFITTCRIAPNAVFKITDSGNTMWALEPTDDDKDFRFFTYF